MSGEGFNGVDLIDEALAWAVGEERTADNTFEARRSLYLILSERSAEFENSSRTKRYSFTCPNLPGIRLPRNVDDVLVVATAAGGTSLYVPANRRLNAGEYGAIVNKTQDGVPSQWYLERTEPPMLFLHGIGTGRDCVVWYYGKPDPYSLDSSDLDAPDRWFRPLALMVARDVVGKSHPVDEAKFSRLATMAANAEEVARRTDRHRTPFRMTLHNR